MGYPIETKQVKVTDENLKNEDNERWVEIPCDYWNTKCIDVFNESNGMIMIERKQNDGKWPRSKGEDWRDTLQTGDIIECKDRSNDWRESLVRCVVPNNSVNAGKCVIHYIGWDL